MDAELDKKQKLLLGYWDPIVSSKNQLLAIDFNLESLTLTHKEFLTESEEIIDGFYASYSEGICTWFRYQEAIYLSWNDDVINLENIGNFNWQSSFLGRTFKVRDSSGKELINIRYRTFLNSLSNPIKLFDSLLDDDWGLVADLPSFIDSSLKDSSLSERLSQLITRFCNESIINRDGFN